MGRTVTNVRLRLLAVALLHGFSGPGICADMKEGSDSYELDHPKTYRLKITIQIDATRKGLRNVWATAPIPIAWPEQAVKLLGENKPRGCVCRIFKFPGQGAMLLMRIPVVRAGTSAVIERTYELTRYRIRFRRKTDDLVVPSKPNAALRKHLKGAPGVEIGNANVKRQAKALWNQKSNAWTNVRRIYDWVRRSVKYRPMTFRGAEFALKKHIGDCEDMSALFVALCRCCGVPARSVWIEGHAYAEFSLQDAKGRCYWIPAQLSGLPEFGQISEYRPILQKTDRLRDPIRKRYVRYVPQSARALGGVPRIRVLRQILTQKR